MLYHQDPPFNRPYLARRTPRTSSETSHPPLYTCLHFDMSLPALTEAQRSLLISSALKGALTLSVTRYGQLTTPTTRFPLLASS